MFLNIQLKHIRYNFAHKRNFVTETNVLFKKIIILIVF